MTKQVAIIMGSDSDLEVMQDAAKILEDLGIGFHLTIVSAHRTPHRMVDFAEHAAKNGFRIIIAGAGGAAHLPGMVASITTLPVIGVPIKSKALSGIDSLHSIVQMPGGIPVATVAINGAKNAGLLAAQILGIQDPVIHQKVVNYRNNLKLEVEEKAGRLERVGYEKYLSPER